MDYTINILLKGLKDMNFLSSIKLYKVFLVLAITTLIFASACRSYAGIIKNPDNKRINTINYKVTVLDSSQNTPLELVTVILKKGDKIINVKGTNHFGNALFQDIEEGSYNIVIQYVGYKNYSASIKVDRKHTNLNVLLPESAIGMQEVVVTGNKAAKISNYVDIKTGYKTFDLQSFHPAPEARMSTVVQENLAGAVRAPTGEVHIRGQHGEFTYLIDGIPIPLGVFGGLNEVVDPHVIKSITFFTGGFPAEYGGQSAAIIDVRTQVPIGKFHFSASSYAGSFLTSNNENLGNKVGTFKALNSNGQNITLSNHAGNLGYFFSASRDESDHRIDQPVPSLFNDHGFDYSAYAKLDYFLGEKDFLTSNLNYSSTYTQIPFDPAEGINFDTQNSFNSFQTLSYYHTFSSQVDRSSDLFIGLYLREGGLKFNTSKFDQTLQYIGKDTATGYRINQDRNFVTYGTRIKFSKELSHHFSYAAGLNFSVTDGRENFIFQDLNNYGPSDVSRFNGSDFSLFAQSNLHPFEWTRIEAGIRYDQHVAPVIQLQKQLNPRLKISFFPTDFNTIYLSYDRLFIPTNIEGLSSIANVVGDSASATFPEKDNLYEAGVIHNFLNGLTAKLDYFHKDSSPGLDDQTLGSSTIRVNVNINQVKVSGVELSLSYNDPESPFSGYLNGSIIHAYGIGPVSGGFIAPDYSTKPFDLDHDQRLSMVIGLNYEPKDWFLSLVGIYGTGLSNGITNYTYKTGLFDFNQAAHTTPAWIFNLSGGYTIILANGASIEPSLAVTNLLDHAHLLKGAFFSSASFEPRRDITFKIKYKL